MSSRSPRVSLRSAVISLRGVGPVRQRQLARAGIFEVGDLLRVLPRRFEDRRQLSAISSIEEPGRYTFKGSLRDLAHVRVRRRGMSLVRGSLQDASGSLSAIWFNRPYLVAQTRLDAEYLLHGEVRETKNGWQLVNASVEAVGESGETSTGRWVGRVVPIYPASGELGPAVVGRLIAAALDQSDVDHEVPDPIPSALLAKHSLPSLAEALSFLHRPGESAAELSVADLNGRSSAAHSRLIYGELLELQLELALVRRARQRATKNHRYELGKSTRARIDEIVPFELTGAQRRVFEEITVDLRSSSPMSRLLQGDVGSGKTIVAAMTLAMAAENDLQGALMAPTEILAEQHHRVLARLLGPRYPVALLTSSVERSTSARGSLAAGETAIVVGTHSLIQESVGFDRLGLVIVDEQHRFGVGQRQRLQAKGEQPDLLVMTATPIPRSLALTVYGDLEVSVIDELPPGRRPVSTRLVSERSRSEVHDWLEGRLQNGEQAYVVCPLIDASDTVKATAIESLEEEICRRFASYCPLVLHGRTALERRETVMSAFAAGECRLLLSTTVIEVGVDVPDATIMIIESAERFGLAQLHQLRGRVGRGGRDSDCIVLHGSLSEAAERRLATFAATNDGFRIAEADLEIRGPGDVLGTRQSGLPVLRVANLMADRRWLDRAREDAREIASNPARFGAADLLAAARKSAHKLEDRLAGA